MSCLEIKKVFSHELHGVYENYEMTNDDIENQVDVGCARKRAKKT